MAQVTEGKLTLVSRRLVGDLSVCCVWDSPNGMRYVTDSEPEQYGLSREQFHERALRNYLRERGEPEVVEDGPILVARTNDAYDATLLLDDRFWVTIASRVRGRVLACVPSRDIVLITGDESAGALQAMRRAAARCSAGAHHLISGTILVRAADRWEVFETEAAAEAAAASSSAKRWWKFW